MISRGLVNKEIAHEMKIAQGSVKQYVHQTFARVGVTNRVELTLWWLKEKGLLKTTPAP
jgi:DNA-binding NarL/FixJ family response regulator